MLADVYGVKEAENVDDPTWIKRAAGEGWVVVTKDELRPWRRVIVESGARIFRIGRAAKDSDTQGKWVTTHINRMVQKCKRGGPWFWVVREKKLEAVTLPEAESGVDRAMQERA
jgi:hypothetical protein